MMTTSSRNRVSGSLPPPPLDICWNVTKNAFQFGPASSDNTDQVYTVRLQMTIPVAALNEQLPKNSILARVQVNLFIDNREFCKAEQSLDEDSSRLDFRVRVQCDPGQGIKDLLALLSARVHFLTAEGCIAFEGEISWGVFSADEVRNGRGTRGILTHFRCIAGPKIMYPIDMCVSIVPIDPAETGAVGFGPHIFRGTEVSRIYGHAQQVPLGMNEPNCVKTEAEDEVNSCANCCSPLDLSLPKDIKPNIAAQEEEGSTLDCGTSQNTRDTSTQTETLSNSRRKSTVNVEHNLEYVPKRLRWVLRRLRPVSLVRNYRFQGRPTRSLRSSPELRLLQRMHHLSNLITRLETKMS